MDLAGRRVLLTGGATGIGRATVLELARRGADLAIVDFNRTEGEAAVRDAEGLGVRAWFLECDVRDEAAVRGATAAAAEFLGEINTLITAAGILQGAFQQIDDLETEVFTRVVDVNLLGTFLFCKHAMPLLVASGTGVILCIASGAGIRGPSSSLAYSASKGGVYGLCYTLERHAAERGIRLHVVCPGSLDTPLKRQNVRDGARSRGEDPDSVLSGTKLGDPSGVARILAFMISSDAGYLQGTVFTR